jgi:hypothetical protein
MTCAGSTGQRGYEVDGSDLTVRQVHGLWAVYRGNNERISRRWKKKELADDALRSADKRAIRKCMCCCCEFSSEGPHNRLCKTCRKVSVGQQMVV